MGPIYWARCRRWRRAQTSVQKVHRIDRGEEAHTIAVAHDARYAQRRCKVHLACTGAADENDVARSLGGSEISQLEDQIAIALRLADAPVEHADLMRLPQ